MIGRELTQAFEGCRLEAYLDAHGQCSIGWGHFGVAPGTRWTQEQADAAFDLDYAMAKYRASLAVGTWQWGKLDEVRQAVLADMAYELGFKGLQGFGEMLARLRLGDFGGAAQAGFDSEWAHQVPGRASKCMEMMRTGQWPSQKTTT